MSEDQADYKTDLEDAQEMMGWNEPKEIITEISGFVPIFECVLEKYQNLTKAAVHGTMWRHCNMRDGVCKASLAKIASTIGVDKATVMRYAKELCDDGYFVDLSPDLRNRPHVYAETGKVKIRNRLTVAPCNATVAPCNATVAQSQLSKGFNKDSNKLGAKAPKAKTIEQAIYSGQPVTADMLEDKQNFKNQIQDTAWLICQNNQHLIPLAEAFMLTRGILLSTTKKDQTSHRKVLKQMYDAKPRQVKPEHVKAAVQSLVDRGMTIYDLHSIYKTAIDLANSPEKPTAPRPPLVRAPEIEIPFVSTDLLIK